MAARKLWIAFAVDIAGRVSVDEGARQALMERGVSLLAAGVVDATGAFGVNDAVEITGPDGQVFAKGLASVSADDLRLVAGRRTVDLPDGIDGVLDDRT